MDGSLIWSRSDKTQSQTGTSVIESFDPATLRFRLREPRTMKVGDSFEVIAPSVNWNIHNNIITACLRPAVLSSYGSSTSLFKNNLVTRGSTLKVLLGVEVHGRFQLLNNHLTGFDEHGAVALALYSNAIGLSKSHYKSNIFENCYDVVTESQPGLWKISMTKDNLTIECVHKIPK